MDGTTGISASTPNFLTKSTTGCGPTLSISLAVMVFMEFAKALFKVREPPYCPSEFLGVQGSGFPNLPASMVIWVLGNSSQGDKCN